MSRGVPRTPSRLIAADISQRRRSQHGRTRGCSACEEGKPGGVHNARCKARFAKIFKKEDEEEEKIRATTRVEDKPGPSVHPPMAAAENKPRERASTETTGSATADPAPTGSTSL